jgi:hypothetical protein
MRQWFTSLLKSFPSPDVAEQHNDGTRRRPLGLAGERAQCRSIGARRAIAGRRHLEIQRLPERAQDQDSQPSRRSRASKAKRRMHAPLEVGAHGQ